MPREQINYAKKLEPTADNPATPSPGVVVWFDPILNVSWHAGGHYVQVSLDMDKAQLAEAMSLDEATSSVEMFTPALSRDEVNKLIRALRKSRDQAFGRDE